MLTADARLVTPPLVGGVVFRKPNACVPWRLVVISASGSVALSLSNQITHQPWGDWGSTVVTKNYNVSRKP